MTILAPDKEQVLEAAIGGLSRVAEAIVAVPTEARTKSLHAAENSYRRTARTWGYDEAEIDEWVSVIMFRLRAEVSAQSQRTNNTSLNTTPHRWCRRPLPKNKKDNQASLM